MKWFRDAEIVRLYRWQIDFQVRMFHLEEERRGKGGRRGNLPDNLKCSSAMRTRGEAARPENSSTLSPICFWTLNSSVTTATIEKNEAKTRPPSSFFFCFLWSYWNIFTENEGRKHLDLSQRVQSGSLFRIFSTFRTHAALWVMLKRSCVQDPDGFLIWTSFLSLTV